MRRILRVLGWMGMSLSALLFVVTVVFWVRSMGHREEWRFEHFEPHPDWKTQLGIGFGTCRQRTVGAVHGRLWFGQRTHAPAEEWKDASYYQRATISADQSKRSFEMFFQEKHRPMPGCVSRNWCLVGMGFFHVRDGVLSETGLPRIEGFTLAVPFWLPALLFALWPTLFLLRRLLRRKRFAAGLCPHCGYDLRATPERCPECGRPT